MRYYHIPLWPNYRETPIVGVFRRFAGLPSWIPAGLVVVSMGIAAVVSDNLADGWVEIPDHWWSTIVVGGPLGLAALWLIGKRDAG